MFSHVKILRLAHPFAEEAACGEFRDFFFCSRSVERCDRCTRIENVGDGRRFFLPIQLQCKSFQIYVETGSAIHESHNSSNDHQYFSVLYHMCVCSTISGAAGLLPDYFINKSVHIID
uniref:Uncharacterized protein n=1 Tax=Corethron hystrix TaxID=216773 RepID=A0A6U5E4G4_9STRA|mmetsp:Transcript_15828/g.35640  ORF Transcript_15828/g.35640 Transcript_15828/m.35640 type:complete len:118 (+) Transcript_15828:627-980(+)